MLVPSIDLMNGKAVQLRQGKDLVLESERDPVELAKEFNRYGEICVIDLDAALGKGNNFDVIEKICRVTKPRVGGGIRSEEAGRKLLKIGAKRLIFGTEASPELLGKFPADRCIVALDHRDGKVVEDGWRTETTETVQQRAQRLQEFCGGFLCTFVRQEGSLTGLPAEEARELANSLKKPLTVAGGINSAREVIELSRDGIDVQVGMALYSGKLDPVETVVESLVFDDKGLIPTVVQDDQGEVLMVAYSNRESLTQALKTGKGIYFSRSRNEIWEKGLTSGSTQSLIACRTDCDRDCLVFTVKQTNVACHRNSYSCFDPLGTSADFSLHQLFGILQERKRAMLPGSYSAKLFSDRKELIAKIKEECAEVIDYTSRENLRWEIADLVYFLSVLAVDEGLDWRDIESELGARHK